MRKILYAIYFVYVLLCALIFLLILFAISLLLVAFIYKDRFRVFYFLFHFGFKVIFIFWGISIQKKYQSNLAKHSLKQKDTMVFVANHASYLDAMIVTASIRKIFRPLGKSGVASIPIIGFLYKQYVILVTRQSVRSKIDALKELESTLKKKYSILLFPEGTFYENITQRLNPFKDGAFHLAIENQTPIQPIILMYARERLNPKSFFTLNPGKIIIYFFDPIPTHQYQKEQARELKEIVFSLMEQKLNAFDYPILESNLLQN